MFCPKCATQNVDGASFCRVCGANISLVPQALTGQLPQARPTDDLYDRKGRRRKRIRDYEPPSLEKGIVNLFVGIGFIVAALAIMARFPAGIFWGWTLFFPAFDRLGRGVAAIVASQKYQARLSPPADRSDHYIAPTRQSTAPIIDPPGGRRTGELVPSPPSVTEGTTRHLGAEAPTRHLDVSGESQK